MAMSLPIALLETSPAARTPTNPTITLGTWTMSTYTYVSTGPLANQGVTLYYNGVKVAATLRRFTWQRQSHQRNHLD